jgi:glycerol-3-phosphate dehydrogenase (NAD(P)+)
MATTKDMATTLSSDKFIVIPGDDVISLQLSGCMKNVIAILVGIIKGLNYGDNLSSAIIAKGINEIKDFARLLNPQSDPNCLAIASDTVMCCTSIKSRNMSFGMQLAIGMKSCDKLVEGKLAAQALLDMMKKHGFNSPLIQLAHDCISTPHNLREKIDTSIAGII